MTLPHVASPAGAVRAYPVRRITTADLDWALLEGWKDFRAKRGDILVLALLYPLIGIVSAAAIFDDSLLTMLFPLIAGISIMGPAAAAGFYEIARRREDGLDSSWVHFVDPLRGRGRSGLVLLTLGLAAIFALWLAAARLIAAVTIDATPTIGVVEFVRQILTTPQGWSLILLGNIVGFGFAAATLVLSFVSFPMVVDDAADPASAVLTSISAARLNPGVTAAWGLRVAGLLFLGCLPAFIGLAIVLPVLGYATWRLYTRLVPR